MGKNIYSFKEASEKTGYKASAIRYYEKEFYLNIPRDNNGRRVFTQKELDTLFFIKGLQEKGYSNQEIKKLMENKEVREEIAATTEALEPGFVKGLENKLQKINESISELNENVNSKERDIIISENVKLKMENKQKAYEIVKLREELNNKPEKKQSIFKKFFKFNKFKKK